MPRIRPIVIGLFRQGERILVAEGFDPVRQLTFFRPIGGGIEFGEHSSEALRREIREELGAEIRDLHFLGMLESRFILEGVPGHELVLVYEAAFVDESWYVRPDLEGVEATGQTFVMHWKSLDAFSAESPLVPEGLEELLRARIPALVGRD